MGKITVPCETSEVSDGFHTFGELYEHRCSLFVALMKTNPTISWRAQHHEDGMMFEGGWCVVGMHLPVGDVTYHIPIKMWDMLDNVGIETLVNAPKFDGHTAADVVKRLDKWTNSLNNNKG